MQGVLFVVSLSAAFALGCRLLWDKVAVLGYILCKDHNVKRFKMEKVTVTNVTEILTF
jgi:hypothetical protein